MSGENDVDLDGCTPRWYIDEQRFKEVAEAVCRCIDAQKMAPREWWEELADITIRLCHRKTGKEN